MSKIIGFIPTKTLYNFPIYDEIMYMEEDLIAAKKDGWYGFARLDSHKDEIHPKYEIEYETED